jgi:hypothetical protein
LGNLKFLNLGKAGKNECNIFSTQFQKKLPNFEFVSKSYGYFTEPPLSYGFEGAVPTWIKNLVEQQRSDRNGESAERL